MKKIFPMIMLLIISSIAQEFRITNDINLDRWPEVDPFTKEIYYDAINYWEHGIYKISIDGGTPELTSFNNIPSFFRYHHKAVYISYEDSLVLYDFNTNSKNYLTHVDSINNYWVCLSPDEEKLFHFQKAPSYYSFLDSSYHSLPISPFAPEGYPFSRIQWKDENNLIFKQYDSPYDTLIVNFNYQNNQLDTIFHLNRENSGIWGIAYNPVYNLLAYSFPTSTFWTYVSLLDLNTMQDTIILFPDTSQTYEWISITEMVWSESGRKLGIIGNHPTIPAGELFLYDLLKSKLDTLTVYPANNEGEKMGLRWFGEDTLIYSKYVYQTDQWQIFGFSTNYLSIVNPQDQNPVSSFQLRQNFPNPFNSATTIPYIIKHPSSIKLMIYDVLGREIKRFSEQNPQIGFNSFTWDGKNSLNEEVCSGIYFYRINYNLHSKSEYSAYNKMVFIK